MSNLHIVAFNGCVAVKILEILIQNSVLTCNNFERISTHNFGISSVSSPF